MYLYGGGSLNINEGTSITVTSSDGQCVYNKGTGTVNMTAGSLSASGDSGQGIQNYGSGIVNASGGTVEASGTNAANTPCAIYNRGTLSISGTAMMTGVRYGVVVRSGGPPAKLDMSGGTVEATGAGGNAIYSEGVQSAVNVTGGTVRVTEDTNADPAIENHGIYNKNSKVTVSGGTVSCAGTGGVTPAAVFHDSNIDSSNTTVSGTATITGAKYGIISAGSSHVGYGDVHIDGGTVKATGVSGTGGIAVSNRGTGLITIADGAVEASGSNGTALDINSSGRVNITGGTVRATGSGSATAVAIPHGGVAYISGGVVSSLGGSGVAIKLARSAGTTVSTATLSGTARVISASDNTVSLSKCSAADQEKAAVFGKSVYGDTLGDIAIRGGTVDGKAEISSDNFQDATVTASAFEPGVGFVAWTCDPERATQISATNGATIASLTTWANSWVSEIYLKAGDAVPTVLATNGSFTDTDNGTGKIGGTITWTAASPAAGIAGYKVYWGSNSTTRLAGHSDVLYTVAGAASTSQAVAANTELPSGATHFLIYSYNASGDSASCLAVAITDLTASGQSHRDRDNPSTAPSAPTTGSDVIVDGERQSGAATVTMGQNSQGQITATVALDGASLAPVLGGLSSDRPVIGVTVGNSADVVVGELNGQTVKEMENKNAVLEIGTEAATYALPAEQIDISAISQAIGQDIGLSDIRVQITIARPSDETVRVVEDSANRGNFTLVVPPVEFSVTCAHGDRTIEISQFNNYVERTIAIPDGVDPAKITTGVVIGPDGAVRHVPTRIITVNGRFYAQVNSLTNSVYSVIWNPVEFGDVANHWAREAVNDMGSRLIIGGVGDGVFEPDRDITRAEFAAIIVRALGVKPGSGDNPFADVPDTAWYCDHVKTATERGIISGYGDGRFGPMDRITREQAMTVVARAMSVTGLQVEYSHGGDEELLAGFADSESVSDYARASIAACVKAGVVSGRSGSLIAPKDSVTRAEVAVIVRRLLQKSNLI